jgi:hypothetical protein
MDVRASANPVLASARRWLARVNARHPWSHNEHFHGAARAHLPGATLRRRLFFRYTLRWDKPPVIAPRPAPATLEPR